MCLAQTGSKQGAAIGVWGFPTPNLGVKFAHSAKVRPLPDQGWTRIVDTKD